METIKYRDLNYALLNLYPPKPPPNLKACLAAHRNSLSEALEALAMEHEYVAHRCRQLQESMLVLTSEERGDISISLGFRNKKYLVTGPRHWIAKCIEAGLLKEYRSDELAGTAI